MAAPVESDVIVLGAGIAGVSLAARLAPEKSVTVLETEDWPGLHATGRSAAMFFPTYGNDTVRALTRASRSFLSSPPAGFAETPLLTPRGCMLISDAARLDALEAERAHAPAAMRPLSAAAARARVPILDEAWLAAAIIDEGCLDLDVAALLQGALKLARAGGAQIICGARTLGIGRTDGDWRVETAVGDFSAPILVNAAGAWADEVAKLAGVAVVGLQPMRRTALTLDPPNGVAFRDWPMVIDVAESFYFKPDAGQLLLSPANEDAQEPGDAAPDELDVAIAIDRFHAATTHRVARINRRWAGLRSFVADRTPVIGYAPGAQGFFWLAGQGGYGIQASPAIADLAAALILERPAPAEIVDEGAAVAALAPDRVALRATTGTTQEVCHVEV